jgi:hypothetical protein
MSAILVAVDFDKDGGFVPAEMVERKGGWSTVIHPDSGEQVKVRNSQVALEDEDDPEASNALLAHLVDNEGEDDEPEYRGDVFPEDIRETYVRTPSVVKGKVLIDNGDTLAAVLRDHSLESVAYLASKVVGELPAAGWLDHYTVDRVAEGKNALNPGMVRMNLGNKIRGKVRRTAKDEGITEGKVFERDIAPHVASLPGERS